MLLTPKACVSVTCRSSKFWNEKTREKSSIWGIIEAQRGNRKVEEIHPSELIIQKSSTIKEPFP